MTRSEIVESGAGNSDTTCRRLVALAALMVALSGCGFGGSDAPGQVVGPEPIGGGSPPDGGSSGGSDPGTGGSGDSGTRDSGHSLGGTISGLGNESGLQLTDSTDTISIDAGASVFSFPTTLPSGTAYAVSIAAQPLGKTCSVSGGIGTIGSADVANIVVTCADRAFHLSGTIRGLSGAGLVLANGTDTLTFDAGVSSFTMPALVAFGSNYALTVQAQPVGLACSVNNGAGVMSAADITAISVTCTDQSFSLGGSITGLGNNSGLVLSNGSDTLSVDAGASSFTMPAAVPYGGDYSVTVQRSPAGMTCTVNQASGSMPASKVMNIAVRCADQSYTLGGAINGLTVAGLVLANGPDTLSVPANATGFTMPTAVAFTNNYSIVVRTQPKNFTCTVSNGAGTLGAGPVTDIAVTCAQSAFTLGGAISGLTSNGLILSNGSETLKVLANATTFTLPSAVATGATYRVSVVSSPAAVSCTVNNGSGVMSDRPVMNVGVTCGPATVSQLYSFLGVPDGARPQSSSLIQGKDGNFYGTTPSGGAYNSGTVFKLTPAGEATVLWSFGAGTDGNSPYSTLLEARDGNLYGTTTGGGAFSQGTVFRITPSGEETVFWSFREGGTGTSPVGGLIEASDGNLYGVTSSGGNFDTGTIFRLTPSGYETGFLLFSTMNGGSLGTGTGGLMQDTDGNLYALAALGGGYGAGAVVKLTVRPDGPLVTYKPFGTAVANGAQPVGNTILASDGNFYGVTLGGGTAGLGTVFRLTPSGALTTVYSFQGGASDGSHPSASLIQANDGYLYGVTSEGGAAGAGTLFRVSLAGEEAVVHSFSDTPGGSLMQGSDGGLYGMTWSGGTSGNGTVYQLK